MLRSNNPNVQTRTVYVFVICAVQLGYMVQLEEDGDEHYTLNATGAHSRGFDAVYSLCRNTCRTGPTTEPKRRKRK